jgi:lipoprotein-releasing system permease protein
LFYPLSIFLGLRYGTARQGSPLVAFLSRVSAVGLALGVALLILVLSVMNGFDREMRHRILAMVPHASIMAPGGIEDWSEVVALAEQADGVVGAAPYVQLQAMLMAGDRARAVMLQGVIPEREAAMSIVEETMVEGSLRTMAIDDNAVIMSRVLADQLGVAVGKSIALVLPRSASAGNGRLAPMIYRAEVAGIYQSNTEIDNFMAYLPLGFAQQLGQLGTSVHGVQLKVSDLMSANRIAREVLKQLPPEMFVQDWMRTHGNLFEAIQLSKKLVSLLVFIIIAVAAFNVVTAMIMVVRDKQGDIAILQTMGLAQPDIMKLFIFQGLVIGLVGTTIGAVIGVLLATNITALVQGLEGLLDYQFLKSEVYPVTYLPADIRVGDIVLVCGTALALTLLATIYPAWRASRLLPAEVLRYDK